MVQNANAANHLATLAHLSDGKKEKVLHYCLFGEVYRHNMDQLIIVAKLLQL